MVYIRSLSTKRELNQWPNWNFATSMGIKMGEHVALASSVQASFQPRQKPVTPLGKKKIENVREGEGNQTRERP